MIDHISLHAKDYEKAKEFYLAALKPLSYEKVAEYPEYKVFGMGANGKADFWIIGRDNPSIEAHIAFAAPDKASIEAFHIAALGAGGKDNGAPGPRPQYSAGYYAAFILDPEGNNIEVVFHE